MSLDIKKGPITVKKMLEALSAMISITECDVFGYYGLDGELIVLLTTVVNHPSPFQVSVGIDAITEF